MNVTNAYVTQYGVIKQGDCLELMKELKDNSVDVCFTSPPYNDTVTKNEHLAKNEIA